MPRDSVNVIPPLLGLDRNWAYQSQPPYSLPDCLNARCRDVFEQRQRLGSRGGHIKAYPQQLGAVVPMESHTMDFFATKDAHMASLTPDNEFGTSGLLQIGPYFSFKYRAIFHFDMAAIPASATILTSTLSAWCVTSAASGGGVSAHKIKRLTQTGWVEAQVNWNDYKAATAWALAGGDFTETDALDWTPPSSVGPFMISGLGVLTQDAYTNRSKHLHLIFMAVNEALLSSRTDIYSRERAAVDATQQPKLTVTYETPV
jgi:hypothetical protein